MVWLNAVCDTRMANRRKTAIARMIITRLRREVSGGRVGRVCTTGIQRSSHPPLQAVNGPELIIDADPAGEMTQSESLQLLRIGSMSENLLISPTRDFEREVG